MLYQVMTERTLVRISNGSIRYKGAERATLSELSLRLPEKSWTCILGKSGCGKSTMLRYLAGLLEDKVSWSGEIETSLSGGITSQVAYMAQQDLLMPWLTVLENVCLSFRFAGRRISPDVLRNAESLIASVGLADYLHHLPEQLSGGMRQRVALARTLMQDKPLVLMDEPFSALDAVTRYQLQDLSARLLKDKTVVLITHDPQEALRLGNAIYLLQGTPARPVSFDVPDTAPPRKLDTCSAHLQQKLIEELEKDYE